MYKGFESLIARWRVPCTFATPGMPVQPPMRSVRPPWPDRLRPAHGRLPRCGRRSLCARGLLSAPRCTAVAWPRSRRWRDRLRLPRPGDGGRWPLRGHAGPARAADDPRVPGDRALRIRLGLAGRQEPGRSGAPASLALGRKPGVDLCGQPVPRGLRLPADDRRPHGPDARDLCARQQHRPTRDRGGGAPRRGSKATRRSRAASCRTSRRRRSGAPHFAATASPTTCRSTAGRSATSPHRAT